VNWDKLVQLVVDGLTTGSVYALIALGFSIVYGILRLLNFAHGDVFMVGAFIGFFVEDGFGGPTSPAIVGAENSLRVYRSSCYCWSGWLSGPPSKQSLRRHILEFHARARYQITSNLARATPGRARAERWNRFDAECESQTPTRT